MNKIKKSLTIALVTLFAAVGVLPSDAFADMEFSVSPMSQKIILAPGEETDGTFEVVNPVYSPGTFYYKLTVEPFSVNDKYEPVFENNGDYNQIVDWIELESETGSIETNGTARINFKINTPATAPAGGQYAIIRVSSDYDRMSEESGSSLNIQNIATIAHVIYAEVAGETERSGEIFNANVPGFLFSGEISGTATVKNTGNVHSDGSYTLQVYPLFSKEEVYTNEENPTLNTIIPEATRTTVVKWKETPSVGIFHVVFKAEFEGAKANIDKIVIVCPLWLLFLILLAIFLIIFRILSAKKTAKKKEA